MKRAVPSENGQYIQVNTCYTDMSDADIIELGEDGSFDISTSSVKQPRVEDVDYMSYDWEKAEVEQRVSLLESLKSSEFATYRDGNEYVIVIRMDDSDGVQSVSYDDQYVYVQNGGGMIKVAVPDKVRVAKETMQCKYYQDFVTIKFQGN
ncbi:hypothetical protein EON63_11600 [archaeon]|nr:MAG: hypothetical protein EON63_11600 [archaeon]